MIATVVLEYVADAFFTALLSTLTADAYEKLKGVPARNAFKQALGAAIQRYAIGPRLPLAEPLLREKGLLTQSVVVTELTHLVRFDREPDARRFGEWWELEFEGPVYGRDFTKEAALFFEYLESELRNTEVFRPAFVAQDLKEVATNTAIATEHLARIESQLDDLIQRLRSDSVDIQSQIRDFTSYIEEKTRNFLGRRFILDSVDQFIVQNPRGYVFLRGDPGIGKTALAAQIVKTHGSIHHFNIRAEGSNKPSDFLKNVCAQLIARYNLPYAVLPPETTEDGGFLRKLLDEVSNKLDGGRCVVVVDALDEVEHPALSSDANTLNLPRILPWGVYFICTMRRESVLTIPILVEIPEQLGLSIEQDDERNTADLREYITLQTLRPDVQTYIQKQQITVQFFIEHMVHKSQGNFMYLRMVLPEIEKGAYVNLELDQIPAGLYSYYEDHWRRMRQKNELDWFDYRLPVIIALTVVKEPVPLDLLSAYSNVSDMRKIRAVLLDFDQFIHRTIVDQETSKQQYYRWYHASFFDFIAKKEEVAEERVDLAKGHQRIADKMWSDLLDE